MIPSPVLAAIAPTVVEKIVEYVTSQKAAGGGHPYHPDQPAKIVTTGGATASPPSTAAAGPPGMEVLTGAITGYMEHQKAKASVRPKIMKMSGQFTIASGVLYVVAAMLPFWDPSDPSLIPVSEHACEMLMWAFGGGSVFYGAKHVSRSVEKMGGKE